MTLVTCGSASTEPKALDLALASAILAADSQIPSEPLVDAILFAGLGLDGRACRVRGAVVAAVDTLRSGRRRIVVARRREKPTLSLDHGVRLTARRSTRGVSPSAAKDCQEQLSATPLRSTSPWRPLARLNSPSVTEAGWPMPEAGLTADVSE